MRLRSPVAVRFGHVPSDAALVRHLRGDHIMPTLVAGAAQIRHWPTVSVGAEEVPRRPVVALNRADSAAASAGLVLHYVLRGDIKPILHSGNFMREESIQRSKARHRRLRRACQAPLTPCAGAPATVCGAMDVVGAVAWPTLFLTLVPHPTSFALSGADLGCGVPYDAGLGGTMMLVGHRHIRLRRSSCSIHSRRVVRIVACARVRSRAATAAVMQRTVEAQG